jgi:hypothetical protein
MTDLVYFLLKNNKHLRTDGAVDLYYLASVLILIKF